MNPGASPAGRTELRDILKRGRVTRPVMAQARVGTGPVKPAAGLSPSK